MAEERKYFLRAVYRYGRVSTVEGRLLKHAQSFRNSVFSASALDRFVQELKDLEAAFLKENPKRPACTVSLTLGLSRSDLPYAAVKIGWHLVWLDAVQGEVA